MTVKWSAFSAGSAIAGADENVGLQGGANVRWTWSQALTYFSGAVATLTNKTLTAPGGVFYVLAASAATGMSVTTGTTETVLATVTIPANAVGANGVIRITALWTYTNSANSKTVRVRLGGLSGTSFGSAVATTTADLQLMYMIRARNSTSSQIGFAANAGASFQTTVTSPATGSVNMAVAQDLVFTGTTALSGETITLESYIVEILN